MKCGILLVAYGSGNMRGISALRAVQAAAEARFRLPVRWAYTSEPMRLRLAKSRTKSDSVLKALSRMRFERYTHVAVQPLHLIPGDEFAAVAEDCAAAQAEATSEAPFRVSLGLPMLACSGPSESVDCLPEACGNAPCAIPSRPDPVGRTASTLISHISPLRSPDEPVIYMAHGSRHASEHLFRRLADAVRALDPLVHVACMIGPDTPRDVSLDDPAWPDGLTLLLPALRESVPPARRIWLLPMLSLVGRHTLDDMAGASPSSWKNRIEAEGWSCLPELRGLADDPAFVALWLDRLADALRTLDRPTPLSSGLPPAASTEDVPSAPDQG
jgi:sirohydrochlorin cobaltochelatase